MHIIKSDYRAGKPDLQFYAPLHRVSACVYISFGLEEYCAARSEIELSFTSNEILRFSGDDGRALAMTQ